ncbi:UDP-N-acetyl-D-mannosamine dehydrogenase [Acinetobacter baumannii]|nr:UDP-N-acetyl-D-mannosamine dehydrogenase [Acinetobacter baumannii]VDA12874.1 UDP-N-acetyl-D-mannosamine dehydrogenase [Acinetobacter baumannii]
MRESPALEITKKLAEQGLSILAIEPNIDELPANMPTNVQLIQLEEKERADIHLILVDHKEFKTLNTVNKQYLIDTKGLVI